MSLHNEIEFETEICQHLAANGWLYSPNDDGYDRARALFPEDVLAWVQETQPKAWDAIVKNHGTNAADTLLTRLRDSLNQRGTLDVLRHGIELLGLRGKLSLAQFKPTLAMNPDILARHAANRLRVMRQVHYSQQNENSIDLMLFLNGLPVATVELKTDFTQSIGDAIDQYRFDRNPKPKGQAAVLAEGPGGKYLIQLSAGSGKTNSIAWSAHFLADLHDAQHDKLFDTVLVVSDRNVIDTQLQEAIFDFERTTGVTGGVYRHVIVVKSKHASGFSDSLRHRDSDTHSDLWKLALVDLWKRLYD